MLDPASGRAWASAEIVSLFLDLRERRALAVPAEALDDPRLPVWAGLTL
jgi:hypothetical protein